MKEEILKDLKNNVNIIKYILFGGISLIIFIYMPMFKPDRLSLLEMIVILLFISLVFCSCCFISILQTLEKVLDSK